MAKAKLESAWRYSRDGIDIDEIPAGTIIEGECAKLAIQIGVAKATQSKQDASYTDDGFVIEEPEELTPEQAQSDLSGVLESIKAGKAELAEIEKLIEAKKAELAELSEPTSDGDANQNTEETLP